MLRKIDWLWSGLSIGGLKHTLIRIERMKSVLDAVKRCDSEGLQLSSPTYRFVSPVRSVFLGHRSYTHARRLLGGAPCLFLFWRGGPQIFEIFGTLELNNYGFNHF